MLRKYTKANSLFQCCRSAETSSSFTAFRSPDQSMKKISLKNPQVRKNAVLKQKTLTTTQEVPLKPQKQKQIKNDPPSIYFSFQKDITRPKMVQGRRSFLRQTLPSQLHKHQTFTQGTCLQVNSPIISSASIKYTVPNKQEEQEVRHSNPCQKMSIIPHIDLQEQEDLSEGFKLIKIKSCQPSERQVHQDSFLQEANPEQEDEFQSASKDNELSRLELIIAQLEENQKLKKDSSIPTTVNNSIKVSENKQSKVAMNTSFSDSPRANRFKKGTLFLKVKRSETVCSNLEDMSPTMKTSKVLDNYQGMLAKFISGRPPFESQKHQYLKD